MGPAGGRPILWRLAGAGRVHGFVLQTRRVLVQYRADLVMSADGQASKPDTRNPTRRLACFFSLLASGPMILYQGSGGWLPMLTRPRDVLADLIQVVRRVSAVVITRRGARHASVKHGDKLQGLAGLELPSSHCQQRHLGLVRVARVGQRCSGVLHVSLKPPLYTTVSICGGLAAEPWQSPPNCARSFQGRCSLGCCGNTAHATHSRQQMQGSGGHEAIARRHPDSRATRRRGNQGRPVRHRKGNQTGSQPEKTASDSRADRLSLLAAAPVAGSQE